MRKFNKYLEDVKELNKAGNKRGMAHKALMADIDAEARKQPFRFGFGGTSAEQVEVTYRDIIEKLEAEGQAVNIRNINFEWAKRTGTIPPLTHRETKYAIDYIRSTPNKKLNAEPVKTITNKHVLKAMGSEWREKHGYKP